MSSLKSAYDAIQPRKRIDFGGYRFVEIDPNARMPKFRCCNGVHAGDESDSEDDECGRHAVLHSANPASKSRRQLPVGADSSRNDGYGVAVPKVEDEWDEDLKMDTMDMGLGLPEPSNSVIKTPCFM